MSTKRIFIIDFEDSFTYNIASVLSRLDPTLTLRVIHYRDFHVGLLSLVNKEGVILGPGPGHPNEYKSYPDIIKTLMNHPLIFLMGICLGHQLILTTLGYKVQLSLNPMHGEVVRVRYRQKWYNVQRYNSLSSIAQGESQELIIYEGDVYGYESMRLISFQFHPESIGTESPEVFFAPIMAFFSA